jgi:trans-2,3-dihydro-3-hydroxyanthranilate isomerase
VKQPVVTSQDIMRAVGIDHAAYEATKLPIEEISCGNAFIFVPVASRAALDAAEPDVAALRRIRSAFGKHVGVFLFTTDVPRQGSGQSADVTIYSRMFAPSQGIVEDPATGSASGPVGCYLVTHGLVPRDDRGDITRVQVGGQSVLVAEATLWC